MTIDPTILDAVAEATAGLDVRVYDVEWAGRILRISLDRDGGVDLDTLTTANRRIGAALDLADNISTAFQLEVGSPGLERPLRTPAHWQAAIGQQVKIKTRPDADGNRRIEGVIEGVDGEVAVVRNTAGAVVRVEIPDVERARTVFVWGPAPKPGSTTSKKASAAAKKPPRSTISASGPQDASSSTPEGNQPTGEHA